MTTVLQHGASTAESRFAITQHRYMGGESGYREVLEINDSERGQKFIVHEFSMDPPGPFYSFSEWASLEDACFAYGTLPRHEQRLCIRKKGLVRFVNGYHGDTPWFYARPGDVIRGDWIAPGQDEAESNDAPLGIS